jgi:uncharacterized protein (TIGR03118 family)
MKSAQKCKNKLLLLAGLVMIAWLIPSPTKALTYYDQVNLVSDGFVPAPYTDPNLINPWGIAYSPTSPFWVSDNGKGLSTLYNGSGQPQGLVVSVPPNPSGGPTGIVFNPNSGAGAFNGDLFLFVSQDGTISGWRGALGTTAEILVSPDPANVYKGAALGIVNGHTYLYAANFKNGTVDIIKGDAGAPALPGNFTDPNLPAGYAPFNVQLINGRLYITYALQDGSKQADVAGSGHGFVNVFDTNGILIGRLISQGLLNSPWGLALAPASFGQFANDLLVGNSGDGLIDAFDPVTGAFLGTLQNNLSNPIVIDGLRGLMLGNGGNGGNANVLYFTSGPDSGTHGLFGSLSPVPETTTIFFLGSGLIGLIGLRRKSKK